MSDAAPAAIKATSAAPLHGIPFREAVRVWARIAALSFGGPAGQIAVMHRILVDEKRWIGENRFLHALNYCMLLPGPEAQQLAVYIGWLLHKTRGGLVAGVLFVLPGLVAIMALSLIYAAFGKVGVVAAISAGGPGTRRSWSGAADMDRAAASRWPTPIRRSGLKSPPMPGRAPPGRCASPPYSEFSGSPPWSSCWPRSAPGTSSATSPPSSPRWRW